MILLSRVPGYSLTCSLEVGVQESRVNVYGYMDTIPLDLYIFLERVELWLPG